MRDTVLMHQLIASLVLLASLHATSATGASAPAGPDASGWDRPGGIFSIDCGHEGMAACTDACTNTENRPHWCPSPLNDSGCLEGLTRLAVTPSVKVTDDMPDICLALPKAGQECGAAGKPCCILPRISQPSTLVRPMCGEGLSCMIPDPVTSVPYGGTNHLQAVLRYSGSQGLLAADVMGTCRSVPALHEAEADTSGTQAGGGTQGVNSVLGQCGAGHARCPKGTYCGANADSMLGGPRCLPMPVCGGAYQQCCPPYSNGEPAVLGIVDKKTAVPTCTSPDTVCVWKSTLDTFDPSSNSEAFQPMTPPGSASMMLQYPDTICIPNLAKCGQAGQPCCPHAQFARSNNHMYFRLHVCDAGLRCNDTISVFSSPKGSKPVLGVCKGTEQTCGRLGGKCCTHIDQAGWEWRHCADGQPGVFCGADNMCTQCPSTSPDEAGMHQASINALSLPGVGNAC